MSQDGIQTVTPRELLDIREQAWSRKLATVSLAAEVTLDVKHREQALTCLGQVLLAQRDTYRQGRVLRNWPAVHVLATTGVAIDHYAGSGGFWPKLTSLLDVTNDQAFHALWGQAFLANLKTLGLPTFEDDDDAGTRYVGRILMHAGIPTYCLGDFYRIINDRRHRVAGLMPEALVSWAVSRDREGRLYNVDRPVARFLRFGEEYAVDVTDRCFDLLDAVAAGGDGADVPLPERFRLAARGARQQGQLVSVGRRSVFRGGAVERPQVVVDPFGLGPVLRLPPVGDAPDGTAVWSVAFDGDVREYPTQALVPGSHEPAPQTDIPISRPVRTAGVAMVGREDLELGLTVVDANDPVLAFAEDGSHLAPSLPLPGGPTWLLLPGTADDVAIDGAATVLAESPLPPGWTGWSLLLMDLEGASCVTIGGGRARRVQRQAAARVVAGEPLRGVRTSTGQPIWGQLPRIEVPTDFDVAAWEVSIMDGQGEEVATWKGDAAGDPNEVWDELPRPLLGTHTVRVRGPWGRGASRTLTLAEGLSVTFDPPWRRFDANGLQPGVARVTATSGITVSRPELELTTSARTSLVRIGTREIYLTVAVTPPHMSVAYQSETHSHGPAVRPLTLFTDDIAAEPGTLILDVGEAADPKLHILAAGGVVQSFPAAGGRHGVYRFDLAKIVDTLGAYPHAMLSLAPDASLPIATTRPRKLFSTAMVSDGGINLTDCADADGLTAHIYACRAPWRGPAVVRIVDGRAELPDHLVNAGPLRLTAQIVDPWAPAPVPDWPESINTVVDADGWLVDGDDEERQLSAYLAGVGDFPITIRDFARLWTARGRLRSLRLEDRYAECAETIDTCLQAHPRGALLALTGSAVPVDLIPSLIIRAGLAWADLRGAHDDAVPPWTVRGALPAALLSAADEVWSQDEIDAAIGVCGSVVEELLGGDDRGAASGRFDDGADVFASQPALRSEFIRHMRLVPQGLLSPDSRVTAAMQVIERRGEPGLEYLKKHAHNVLAEVERLFRLTGDSQAKTAVAARRHPTATGGWRVMPAISIGLAFAARTAARGEPTAAGWLPRQRRVWADLAMAAPDLVTIDLLVAEMLVASRTQGGRIQR